MLTFVMEYMDPTKPYGDRVQQLLFAESLKEAKQKAKKLANLRGVSEYYVRRS